MDSVSFLFVPWGNPYQWKETTYVYDSSEDVKKCVSFTTLPLLLDIVKPDFTVILALDTLAPYMFLMTGNLCSSYRDIVEFSREAVRYKLESLSLEYSDIHIEILPGSGRYMYVINDDKKAYIGDYRGRITDYKYSLAYFLSMFLIDKLSSVDQDVEIKIYLDLTHGQNYMPTFTYDILLSLARILRYRFRKVSFTVFNSDPYIHGPFEHKLNIVVDVKNLATEFMSEKIGVNQGRLLKYNVIKSHQRIRLRGLEKSLIKNLNTFTGGIVNGLPLVILSFYPDVDKLEDYLKWAIETYADESNVVIEDDKFIVEHIFSFSKDFEVLSKIMLVSKIIKDFVEPHIDGYYEWSSVKKITGIYDATNRNHYTIHNEIRRVEESIEEFLMKSDSKEGKLERARVIEKKYRDILPEGEYGIGNKATFTRNFLSHAGLEKNITIIKLILSSVDEYDVMIRYALDDEIRLNGNIYKVSELVKEAAQKDLISIMI